MGIDICPILILTFTFPGAVSHLNPQGSDSVDMGIPVCISIGICIDIDIDIDIDVL